MLKIGSAFKSPPPIFIFQLKTLQGGEVRGAKSRSHCGLPMSELSDSRPSLLRLSTPLSHGLGYWHTAQLHK